MQEQAQFDGMIGPLNLLSQVRNTAPFLFDGLPDLYGKPRQRLIDMGDGPLGYARILFNAERLLQPSDHPTPEEREDYFALCLACHHATVGTFVATDVDSKIRGVLWQKNDPSEIVRRRFELVLQAMSWDLKGISTRTTEVSGVGPVSGHNGEMLSVLAGALGTFIRIGDNEYAALAAEAIENELAREVYELRYTLAQKNSEIDLLKVCMSLIHNVGDLDQGISFWKNGPAYDEYRTRFGKLGHENTTPFAGAFVIAGALYKTILASEGHRHYPLREVRALRKSRNLLLPLGPFFDDWGFNIGSTKELDDQEKADVLCALLQGCKKIIGQMGYFRAIAGIVSATEGRFERICKLMPTSARTIMKDPELKKKISVSKLSFESSYKKRVQVILAAHAQSIARQPALSAA